MATRSALHDPSRPKQTDDKRRIRFLPLPTKTPTWMGTDPRKWKPGQKIVIRKSLWLWLNVLVLFISTILYLVAFLTNGWGRLIVNQEVDIKIASANRTGYSYVPKLSASLKPGHVTNLSSTMATTAETTTPYVFGVNDRYWDFGLWQCCRNDGFCLGTRWPAFYATTRTFAVLGLFGLVLSLCWMLGHAMENLIEYDPCTNISLISLNISTGVFLLIAVSCFGALWPEEFKTDFHGVQTFLNYSFYLTVDVVILVFIASGLAIVDYVMLLKRLRLASRADWVTAEEILGEEDADDEIQDNEAHSAPL